MRPMNTLHQWQWTVPVRPETVPLLQWLAKTLGFTDEPGEQAAPPDPAAFLDALAAAYQREPAAVREAMEAIGVVPEPVSAAVE